MKKRILIVEDELDLLDLIDFNLTRKGFTTTGSLDGLDAMQKLESFNPDLVVLDLMLPKLNGWEICKAIKDRNREIPVIMLTAKSMPEDKVRGFETGADDYITKPFNIKELVIRINNLLEKKTQSELSRMLIHEMGNRMTAIGCYSELLSNKHSNLSDDNKNRYIKSISNQVADTTKFIYEIGSLAVAVADNEAEKTETTDLNEILKDLAGFHALAAEHKRVTILFEEKAGTEVALNCAAVKQVLTNLIGNAVKYSRENGCIEISTTALPGGVIVGIKDDGVGIHAADAPHIFKKGFRGSNVEKNTHGSGLGLYMIKQILDRMNSTITFWSEEGKGTTFAVFFIRSNPAERLKKAIRIKVACQS